MENEMEDPAARRPDIILDAAAQMVIQTALDVAKHNQEFRDGTRAKPFNGVFVCREIDNALRVLGEARHSAQTMRIETAHEMIGHARRSAFAQCRTMVHGILMEYATEHFDPIIPPGDVPAAYMDALDTVLQAIDDSIHQEFGNSDEATAS